MLRTTGDDTETTQKRHRHDTDTGVEKPSYDRGARWREGLQPDQSRRWSAEQNREGGAEIRLGTARRLGAEGRSPTSGALGRLTRAEGKRLLSLSVLPFSLYTLFSRMASPKQSKAAPFIA